MKKSILVTGTNGSGKSEVGRRLKVLGYNVLDMDNIPELCVMVDRKTGIPTEYDNGNDIEKAEKMYWLYRKDKLDDIITNQSSDLVFYCGAPNNLIEILSSFDAVILLVANEANIRQRLSSRKDNGFGKSIVVQDYILSRKEKMENYVIKHGAVVIDANQNIDLVVASVIHQVK